MHNNNNDQNQNLNKVKELIQLFETRCQALYDRLLQSRTKPKEKNDLGKDPKLSQALDNREGENKNYTLSQEQVKTDSRNTKQWLPGTGKNKSNTQDPKPDRNPRP